MNSRPVGEPQYVRLKICADALSKGTIGFPCLVLSPRANLAKLTSLPRVVALRDVAGLVQYLRCCYPARSL